MGLEREVRVYDYYDLVPRERWVERNLPTFLSWAKKVASLMPPVESKSDYPALMTIALPSVDYDDQTHSLSRFLEMAYQLAERLNLGNGWEQRLEFQMDDLSYQRVIDIPFSGDGTFGGEIYFHAMALRDYCTEWFKERGYSVFFVGVTTPNLLELGLIRVDTEKRKN